MSDITITKRIDEPGYRWRIGYDTGVISDVDAARLATELRAKLAACEPPPERTEVEIPETFDMYTAAGNKACQSAAKRIVKQAKSARDHGDLLKITQAEMAKVAEKHREVYDTEPRYHFGCVVNRICKAKGWDYDPYDSGL